MNVLVLERPVGEIEPIDLDQAIKECEPELLCLIRSRLDHKLAACIDPRDILQDALVKGTVFWASCPPRSSAAVCEWLRRKVLDCLLDKHDYIRARKRDVARAQRLPGGSSDQGGSQLAGSSSTPSAKFRRKEMQDRLLHALSELKPSYAEILRLHDLEGRKLEDIAMEMGLRHENVRARHARAFRRLKDLWKKLYGDEDFQL